MKTETQFWSDKRIWISILAQILFVFLLMSCQMPLGRHTIVIDWETNADTTNVTVIDTIGKIPSGRTYLTGARGGCYYINSNGNKTYVDKSLCFDLPPTEVDTLITIPIIELGENPAAAFIDTVYVNRIERTWMGVSIRTQDFCQAVAWFSEDGFEYPKVNKGRKEESFTYQNHSLRIGYNGSSYGTGFPELKPNTKYYIRVYVTNKDGITYGSRELIATTKI